MMQTILILTNDCAGVMSSRGNRRPEQLQKLPGQNTDKSESTALDLLLTTRLVKQSMKQKLLGECNVCMHYSTRALLYRNIVV